MKRLLIITALLTMWLNIVLAQDDSKLFMWEVHTVTMRDGRTRQAMEKSQFLKPMPPPKDQQTVIMSLLTFNGILLGNISFGNAAFDFNDYKIARTSDGHKYMEFLNDNRNVSVAIFFGIKDTDEYEDSAIVTLFQDDIVTQLVYMMKRVGGFD